MYFVWLTDDEQRLWREYLAMTAALDTAMNRQLQRDHGLSLTDYDVLVALADRPGCRVSELAEALGWEQSRLSHQLRRMRERGLVKRRDVGDDRRAAAVGLTAAGRRVLTAAAPGHVALVREMVFDGLTGAEADALLRWTMRVRRRLERQP